MFWWGFGAGLLATVVIQGTSVILLNWILRRSSEGDELPVYTTREDRPPPVLHQGHPAPPGPKEPDRYRHSTRTQWDD